MRVLKRSVECGEGKIAGEHPQEAEQTEETGSTPVFRSPKG